MTTQKPQDPIDVARAIRDRSPNLGDALWLHFRWLTRNRPRERCCPLCGYPVRGITSGQCPECGNDLLQSGAVVPYSQATWLGGYVLSWLLGGVLGIALFVYLCSWSVVSFVPAEHWPYREVKFEEHGHLYVDRYLFFYRARGESAGWAWPWQPLPTPVDRAELSMPAVQISDASGEPLYLHHHSPNSSSPHRFAPATRARLDITRQTHEVQVPQSRISDYWLSKGGTLASPTAGDDVFADELLRTLWSGQVPGPDDADADRKLRLIYQSAMAGKPAAHWEIDGLRFDSQQSEAISRQDPFRRSVTKSAWLLFAVLIVIYLYLTRWIVAKRRHRPRVCKKLIRAMPKSTDPMP